MTTSITALPFRRRVSKMAKKKASAGYRVPLFDRIFKPEMITLANGHTVARPRSRTPLIAAAIIAALWFIERRVVRKRMQSATFIDSATEDEKASPAEEDTFTEFLSEIAQQPVELTAEAVPSAEPAPAPQQSTAEPEQVPTEEKPTE